MARIPPRPRRVAGLALLAITVVLATWPPEAIADPAQERVCVLDRCLVDLPCDVPQSIACQLIRSLLGIVCGLPGGNVVCNVAEGLCPNLCLPDAIPAPP